MSIINLNKIFKPHRIALLGGNWHLGSIVLRNLLDAGFPGVIYPIDSHREAVNGIPTYFSVGSLPKTPDLALICAPAKQVPADVEECARAGVRGIVILSGGFREIGPEGQALEHRITEIARGFPRLRIMGPNSLGFIAPRLHLNASHAATFPMAGHLVFLSESRGLCSSVLDWAMEAGVGFSYFVSVGNMLNVGFGDLIDYFSTDPNTRAIILYLESVENARRFMSAASAFARKRPIIAYKAGHFIESARVAASHTGAMVSEDAVYAAAFERAGIVRVTELNDVFDVAEVLASQWMPKGPRLAILGNAGGPAIIAADVLLAHGGILATLRPQSVEALDGILPPVGSSANPVDLLDSAPPERFADATRIVLMDQNVDGVLVIFAIQSGIDPKAIAQAIANVANDAKKPILAVWMGGTKARAGMSILSQSGIPTYSSPEQGVRAFLHLMTYARNIETLYQTPRHIPIHFDLNRTQLRRKLSTLLRRSGNALNEYQAKIFLETYGIPVIKGHIIHSREAAIAYAERLGYPVVLKVLSPRITHKMDLGGVALNLRNAREVQDAYDRIFLGVRTRWRNAHVEGISIQKMANLEYGVEMILGAKRDPTFGTVIMVGMGGFAANAIHDRWIGLPPLNERLATRMLESLRHWPMLQGYRSRPGIDKDRLIEVMLRFSHLVTDYPEIREFDINPLLVGRDNVIALDAAATLEPDICPGETDIHKHLAICPYPEEHVWKVTLDQGIPVTFRPVRPEDEPLWHKFIACSSEHSIRRRFRSFFSATTHQMAIEYCVIDYEREIAIVAETGAKGEQELIGIAHMFADASLDSAEYAVIVSDPWQRQGLGGRLLDHCLELAERWGIKRVVANTEIANKPMLENFRSRGFKSDVSYEDGIVYLEKPLPGSG
uniref:Acetyltransferase n=1 Tax=Candidatus Kentrum sp. SD TaxID=2126332 RepID=A0A451BR93_9GAMM|nr:MAG: acetyltransferase [Candidatus Kentron sp. SD]VFK49214.1 MAG: acetyltransferase [Candidatus Kentron sp. SD]VFK80814.1 MAG: acetyltransferase [Candidatus Kentron sp. SD]